MSIVIGTVLRILIFVRVSTLRQKEKGTSLDTQEEEIRRLMEYEGHHGAEVFVLRDQGSGADPDRPGFRELFRRIADGECDAVYAHSPDRVARDPMQLMMFAHLCEESGVSLYFVEGPSGTSPEAKLMQYFYGFMAQGERRKIAERTTRGKRAVARSGRLPVGCGHGLFGYDYDKLTKARSINPREAAVVRWIFALYAAGLSLLRIRKTLALAGITTKTGAQWPILRIWKVLKNESYTGVDYYGRTRCRTVRGGKVEQTPRPPEEWIRIEGFTPQLISTELFDEVQRRLGMDKDRQSPLQRSYLLTGFMRCRKCGSRVVGASRKGLRRFYRCRGNVRVGGRPAICHEGIIYADEMESVVWDHVIAAITHPEVIASGLLPHLDTGSLDWGKDSRRLRREIARLKSEERKLVRLYASGKFDEEVLKSEVAPVRLLMAENERALLHLEERQSFNEDPAEKSRRLAEHTRSISEALAHQDFDAQRATLLAFGVKIEVGRGKGSAKGSTKRPIELSIELDVDPS